MAAAETNGKQGDQSRSQIFCLHRRSFPAPSGQKGQRVEKKLERVMPARHDYSGSTGTNCSPGDTPGEKGSLRCLPL